MAYSKAKLKSSGDRESPCFRPFWMGKLSDNVYLYGLNVSFKHILINLNTCKLSILLTIKMVVVTSDDSGDS
jgi:hypothetical protein